MSRHSASRRVTSESRQRRFEDVGEAIAVRQVAPEILKHAISASSAGPISSALVAAMSRQMSAGLDASRVVSASRGRRARARLADGVADDLHQRARGELRQMAEKREQAIVRGDVDDARLRAERADERRQLLERIAARRSSASAATAGP